MHQYRNLILSNFICLLFFVGQSALINSLISDKFMLFVASFISTIIISLIVYYLTSMISMHTGDELIIPAPIIPLASMIILVLYFKSKIKVIRNEKFRVLSFYHSGEIMVIYFNIFNITLLESITFNGKEEEKQSVIDSISDYYNRGLEGTNGFNYRDWDGTLNTATKRKETIDNIIK